MRKNIAGQKRRSSQAGISLIEVLMASVILVIGSLGMILLIVSSIATNSRNKLDSTQTMLANSVLEQITSTIIGVGTSSLSDCAGNTWTIDTAPGGATLNGARIDFTEASPPADYHMNYVVSTPCTSTGARQGIYDVRWHVEIVGASVGTPTTTYMLTVGARMQNHGEGNIFFSFPVNFRVMAGN